MGVHQINSVINTPHILIYIQQHATLHSLFYLETALHVSDGTSTHHQERKQLYLQHLVFVTPLLLPTAIMEELELVSVCYGWHTRRGLSWGDLYLYIYRAQLEARRFLGQNQGFEISAGYECSSDNDVM